ncbi:hypothetical protein [Zavarzinia compransoris]|uniref:DUF1254 domain-containing protein n=1 Tax=Zavarzinia compransoris TaxID=1264899 RepID=A0A317ECT7_9PROT|nr:hypothetical protein [Zavarzinia compransoris]PWR23950.1 hypothetical protein DKG75_05210 [Zavarzinia compransoris]TDP48197.1 hypothetical protein DES42_102500 [Zavarzinia compransoris]
MAGLRPARSVTAAFDPGEKMRPAICVFLIALTAAPVPAAPGLAAEVSTPTAARGTASGILGTLRLTESLAALHNESSDPVSPINYIRVVLDDRAIKPWQAGAYPSLATLRDDAIKGKDPVVMLEVDVENTEEVFLSAFIYGPDQKIYTIDNTLELETLSIDNGRISGSFEGDHGTISFDAPINRFPITSKQSGSKARASEPFKIFASFLHALADGDRDKAAALVSPLAMPALRRLVEPGEDMGGAAAALDLIKPLVSEVYYHGDRAVIVHRDPKNELEVVEEIAFSLVRSGGRWLLDDR